MIEMNEHKLLICLIYLFLILTISGLIFQNVENHGEIILKVYNHAVKVSYDFTNLIKFVILFAIISFFIHFVYSNLNN